VLPLDLFWQALSDGPEVGIDVLQLVDDSGLLLAEAPGAGGASWAAGQAIREPLSLELPGGLAPGVYNLVVGRRGADGSWLPVRRGPFVLGTSYPLATVRVLDRPVNLIAPMVQYPVDARFGTAIRLVGYGLDAPSSAKTTDLTLTLCWQSLAPAGTRFKIFVHLVDPGRPSSIRAQADLYPGLPTTAWAPGEYLCDGVTLALPPDLAPGRYDLIAGLYDEASSSRLPVLDAAGQSLGDSLLLQQISLGQ